jgi:putative inorganic carbon (HCO3(-)) transporter
MGLNTGGSFAPDGDQMARTAGTFGSPNTAGGVLGPMIAVALGLAICPERRFRRFAMAAVGIGIVALVLTGSRGSWLGLVVTLATVGSIALRQGLISLPAAGGATLLIGVVMLPVAGVVATRLSADAEAAVSRIPLARLGVKMIEDRPLLGVGLNNVGVSIEEYAGPEFSREWLYTIHNKYLVVAAESGVLALAALVWFLLAVIRRAVRCVRSRDPWLVGVSAGLLGAVLAEMTHMTVDIFTSRGQVQLLWLLGAMIVVASGLLATPPSTPAQRPVRWARPMARPRAPAARSRAYEHGLRLGP